MTSIVMQCDVSSVFITVSFRFDAVSERCRTLAETPSRGVPPSRKSTTCATPLPRILPLSFSRQFDVAEFIARARARVLFLSAIKLANNVHINRARR